MNYKIFLLLLFVIFGIVLYVNFSQPKTVQSQISSSQDSLNSLEATSPKSAQKNDISGNQSSEPKNSENQTNTTDPNKSPSNSQNQVDNTIYNQGKDTPAEFKAKDKI
jgi:hypothetical protein